MLHLSPAGPGRRNLSATGKHTHNCIGGAQPSYNQSDWPRFLVLMCLAPIANDSHFEVALRTSIHGLQQQEYRHWVARIRGDSLSPAQEERALLMLNTSLPAGSFVWSNGRPGVDDREHLAVRRFVSSLTEKDQKYLNLGKRLQSMVWYTAGTNCGNENLRLARAAAFHGATHIAHLDDDDVWLPDHLQLLALAYMRVPGAGFAYSVGMEGHTQNPNLHMYVSGQPRVCGSLCGVSLHFAPPWPGEVVRASTSYSLDNPVARLAGRNVSQMLYAPSRTFKRMNHTRKAPYLYNHRCRCNDHPGGPHADLYRCAMHGEVDCPGNLWHKIRAGDADFWDRVWDLQLQGELTSLVVAKVTVIKTTRDAKNGLLKESAQIAARVATQRHTKPLPRHRRHVHRASCNETASPQLQLSS